MLGRKKSSPAASFVLAGVLAINVSVCTVAQGLLTMGTKRGGGTFGSRDQMSFLSLFRVPGKQASIAHCNVKYPSSTCRFYFTLRSMFALKQKWVHGGAVLCLIFRDPQNVSNYRCCIPIALPYHTWLHFFECRHWLPTPMLLHLAFMALPNKVGLLAPGFGAQIELKRRLEVRARNTEASEDRVRAAQLDAAIKADRRREMMVKRLDMERINK